jgi:hypothetical protein
MVAMASTASGQVPNHIMASARGADNLQTPDFTGDGGFARCV